MNENPKNWAFPRRLERRPAMEANGVQDSANIEHFFAIVRRQWRVACIFTVLAIVLSLIYVYTAVPLYTASTSVLIDRQEGNLVGQLTTIGTSLEDDSSVTSQVELLKSRAIAYDVVDKLKLADDPSFFTEQTSVVRAMFGLPVSIARSVGLMAPAMTPSTETASNKRRSAVEIVERNMSVARVGRSYVLTLYYTSPSPDMAARIAAAFADVYMVDKLNSKFEATRRASDWLQERVEELGKRATESDLAVQVFRESKGLVTSEGKLVSDQQLSELNSALIVARSNTAQAKARLDRIQALLAKGPSDAIVSDVLSSAISNDLRTKYLEASKLETDIASRFGAQHEQAVKLRADMAEYQRQMFAELSRIAESYDNELGVAEAREKELATSVSQAEQIATDAGKNQVQLRELERSRDTYSKLHETFLQRYNESVQEQSYPVAEARVIEASEVPDRPSYPQKSLVVALSAFLGAVFGTGFGAMREIRDRFFRTAEQIREELGIEYLGSAPIVMSQRLTYEDYADDGEETAGKEIRSTSTISQYAANNPMSMFAETIRSAKIAIDLATINDSRKVVGFISSLPDEGKSTVAINFAELLASQGARVLLIDADLRNPGSTRLLGSGAEFGLVDVLLKSASPEAAFLKDARTGMFFLPAVVKRRIPNSADLLASPAMTELLSRVSREFGYVVLDLPPLGPVVDARAVAPHVGAFVFVIEWGKTSRRVVKSTLLNEVDILAKCCGAILNKVDTKRLKLYRAHGSSEYYYSRYNKYYRT